MKTPAVIAGSLVVLAAAYTGSAWYVGMEAEKTIRAAVEQANTRIVKTLGPEVGSVGATVSIDEYRRGVFSSSARYTFHLQDGDERSELAFQDTMQHGPFPWGLLQQGELAPQLAYSRSQLVDTETVKQWFDAARGNMPLSAETRIGFGGTGASEWKFAPLEWLTEDQTLSFSGGNIAVEFSNDFRDSTARGNFASLVLGGGAQGDSITLKDIGLAARTLTADDESVQVNSRMDVKAMTVDTDGGESLHLDEMAVVMDSTQRSELLDSALRYEVKRVRFGEIDLGSIVIGGKAAAFNFEAFSLLMKEYDAIAQEHGAGEDEDFDLTPEDEARLLARLVPLLASSPQLGVEPVSWSNEKGKSTLSLNMAFQPLEAGDARAQEEALADALSELRFGIELSRPMLLQVISEAAGGGDEGRQFEMFAAMIFDNYVAQLDQQGLVDVEDDRVLMKVAYQDGRVNVNGQEMSVDEFMSLLSEFGL